MRTTIKKQQPMKLLKFFMMPLMLGAFIVLASATSVNKETERIHASRNVLETIATMHDGIPREILEKYSGIVIIPHMINAGFAVGVKHGNGIAMVKLPDGRWSDPVFITLNGGSLGLQIGVQSVDLVLVFRHKGVLERVKNGDFTIGGDVSATAGPVGRNATASTDAALKAEVYSYSRSRGLFAGITINGANLGIDHKADHRYYGEGMTTRDIFTTSASTRPAIVALKATLASLR
jgi:lipid-binding SYLF domain-containing protein